MTYLHLTNGRSAAELIAAAGHPGKIFSWDDVLHDGPVPGGLSIPELDARRARFISDSGWADTEEASAAFQKRRDDLNAASSFDRIFLWFEHDLYDQLQLIQILAELDPEVALSRAALIQTDDYIGEMSPADLEKWFEVAKPVNQAELAFANAAWLAFRASDPRSLKTISSSPKTELPFVRQAFRRLERFYPHLQTGVSLTEEYILELLDRGEASASQLFRDYQSMEEFRFMGDSSFFRIVEGMARNDRPLIETTDGRPFSLPTGPPRQALRITTLGTEVLRGDADWLADQEISKWIGGVELGPDARWRWDPAGRCVVQKAS